MDILTTKRNYEIAKSRNFTCMLCRKQHQDYAFKKSGYFCYECSMIINVMTVIFIIIVASVLIINSLS